MTHLCSNYLMSFEYKIIFDCRKAFDYHLKSVHGKEASFHCQPCNASFHTAIQLHYHENYNKLHKRVRKPLLVVWPEVFCGGSIKGSSYSYTFSIKTF